MDPADHWERVFARTDSRSASWFEARPETSLELMERSDLGPTDPIIDIGGGTSRLVDELLLAGYGDLTVLDVSRRALESASERLGEAASAVHWICSDILSFEPNRTWKLWHDRAMFHFLIRPEARNRYVAALRASLEPGGFAILSGFALDGPQKCSGLPVQRLSVPGLSNLLGDRFELLDEVPVEHRTPTGTFQRFLYCRFQYI